jgi:hypothetical protein
MWRSLVAGLIVGGAGVALSFTSAPRVVPRSLTAAGGFAFLLGTALNPEWRDPATWHDPAIWAGLIIGGGLPFALARWWTRANSRSDSSDM